MKKLLKRKPIQVSILIVFIVCILIFLKNYSTEYIPYEDPKEQKMLDVAITISKFNVDEGIDKLENLTNVGNYTEYKKNYVLAKLHEKKQEIYKSLSIYENIINKNYPLKERVIFHYANLNAQLGNDKIALKFFNKVLFDFPYSRSIPQTKYYLAQTQFRLKFINQAINILLALKSEFPETQYGIAADYYLGEYAYNKEKYKEALQYWREYLKLSPDGRFANDIVNLIRDNKNINLKPDDYSLLGNVFYHKKDYLNAAYYYKTGNNFKKYYELGYSLFRLNKNPEAYRFFKEYAYSYPKSKNVKWALLYASKCIPYHEQKSFWEKTSKDIPELAHYCIYKKALLEENERKKENLLSNLLVLYPNSEFVLDAVWHIMWQRILDENYKDAEEIGKKYFELSKDLPSYKSETRAKVGFFLGKIAEILNQKPKAIDYYGQAERILFDNYYSLRAKSRLKNLNGEEKNNNQWNQTNGANDFNNVTWLIPTVMNSEKLKNHYGSTISELIKLQEYDEAIDLIGKSKSPSKRLTSWLEALNSEYESSINIANSIGREYNLDQSSTIWKLAYPLHFWQHILNFCKQYPNLDPLLVCGLIRQESRFETKAVSVSNALGLMQLIPPTARTVAYQAMINLTSLESLFDPKINIALGTHYLSGLVSDFENPLFAVASYNAGPAAVKRWINNFNKRKNKNMDLDFFVEEIPYDQTREYVKKVFSSYWVYKNLYNN